MLVAAVALTFSARAQDASPPPEAVGTSSPRSTLAGFIEVCEEAHQFLQDEENFSIAIEEREALATRMLHFLDMSQQPTLLQREVGAEAAVCLKEVLDRVGLPPESDIPDQDGLTDPETKKPIAEWIIPETAIAIRRVTEGPREGQYLFSPDTVAQAVEMYKQVEQLPYKDGATEDFYTWLRAKVQSVAIGAEEPKSPLEPADTSSPRATLYSFINACNETYRLSQLEGRGVGATSQHKAAITRILRCLDVSQEAAFLQDDISRHSAVCLKEVLDRIELPPEKEIPGKEAIEGSDTPIARWTIPHTEITIHRVTEGPRTGDYLFSPETVARAGEFYRHVEHLPYKPDASEGFYEWFLSEPGSAILAWIVHRLPGWTKARILDNAVWQWVMLILTVIAGFAVMFVVYRMGQRIARFGRESSVLHYCLSLLFPIAAILVPLVVQWFVRGPLVITGWTLVIVKFTADLVFLVAVLVVVIGAGGRIAEIIIASPRINPKGIDAQFIRLISRVLSLGAAAIVFLEGGKYFGIPLTTLLAGAGVGGLALALAAQDTLKNLFGSMMIILDKPYRVGERIVTKGYDGIVEEIGMRSTKIRLLTGHMAAIPNEEMARSDIENVGRRPHIRRIADIAIPLDTPQEKAKKAIEIVRNILEDHEGQPENYPPRVYLNEFNRDSLNLRMIYWYEPPAYWDFLAFSEKVNLGIKREFEAAGIRFALPTSTTMMAQDDVRPLELKLVDQAQAPDTNP
jgi:MscS family membrane protein